MKQSIIHLLAVLLCLVPLGHAAGLRASEEPKAPDGHRGFGSSVDLGKLLKKFRTPNKADHAFILELESLSRDVGVFADVTEGFYRDRGFFELLDPVEDQTLEVLHASYARYERDPSVVANRPKRIGRAFARMFLDSRFRVRRHLLESWTREAGDIERGLAVIQGAAHGYVILDGGQASNIARRLDLSAAILRSIRSDLESLREPPDSARDASVSEEEVTGFLDLFNIGDRTVREASQATAFEREQTSEQRMRSVLFTERLKKQASDQFSWRRAADSEASERLDRALEAEPDGEKRDDVPRQVSKLSKSKRRKLSRQKSLEGLSFDPLDEELAWIAGIMSSFVFGELETASHLDRFLVLRGISYRAEATYADRELTERERIALKYVQEIDRRVGNGSDN